MGRNKRTKIANDILDCKPPGGSSVVDVWNVFTGPMTNVELSKASGLSGPTVSLVMKFMCNYGDAVKDKRINVPTGTTKLFDEYKLLVRPKSNVGVTGVSFIARTQNYHICYGRKRNVYSNNLFDAVCKRKSLELRAA